MISIKESNSATIECVITGIDSLSGYTGTLYVSRQISNEVLFSKVGSILGMTITFNTDDTDNDLNISNYNYEIIITDGTYTYSVKQGIYSIAESFIL